MLGEKKIQDLGIIHTEYNTMKTLLENLIEVNDYPNDSISLENCITIKIQELVFNDNPKSKQSNYIKNSVKVKNARSYKRSLYPNKTNKMGN